MFNFSVSIYNVDFKHVRLAFSENSWLLETGTPASIVVDGWSDLVSFTLVEGVDREVFRTHSSQGGWYHLSEQLIQSIRLESCDSRNELRAERRDGNWSVTLWSPYDEPYDDGVVWLYAQIPGDDDRRKEVIEDARLAKAAPIAARRRLQLV